MMPIDGRISGSLIFQNADMPVTPSVSAASRISSGIDSSAA